MGSLSNLIEMTTQPETVKSFNSLVVGGGIAIVLVFVISIIIVALLISSGRNTRNLINEIKDSNKANQGLVEKLLDTMATWQNDLKGLLEGIKKVSGLPYLNKEALYKIFEYISKDHVRKKIFYIKEVLTENDIHNRADQIKTNIERKFRDITQKECNTLSMFNTVFLDVGKIFADWIDWDLFLKDVYRIIFSCSNKETKLNDLENLMDGYLSDFWEHLTK